MSQYRWIIVATIGEEPTSSISWRSTIAIDSLMMESEHACQTVKNYWPITMLVCRVKEHSGRNIVHVVLYRYGYEVRLNSLLCSLC